MSLGIPVLSSAEISFISIGIGDCVACSRGVMVQRVCQNLVGFSEG